MKKEKYIVVNAEKLTDKGKLERAKSKIKNDKDHVLYEDDIIEIFPKLKESEDEVNEDEKM